MQKKFNFFKKKKNKTKNKMNFSVGIIVKNEEKNIDHIFNDLKDYLNDGGDLIILDTGSTDNTVEKCRKLGIRIEICPESHVKKLSKTIITKINDYIDNEDKDKIKIKDSYFNFSNARNYIHKYTKHNMVLQLDASHHLINFDYKKIKDLIKNEKIQKFEYRSYYSSIEFIDKPSINDIQRFYNKIHFSWIRYVHEVLDGPNNLKTFRLNESELSMRHIKNNEKERNYIEGLFDDYLAHPQNPRCIYYLGRDLFYIKCYKSCIGILQKLINIDKSKVWLAELSSAYIIIGDCYLNLNCVEKTIENYNKAHLEFKGWREPLIKLALLKINLNEYKEALDILINCLTINKVSVYVENSINYTYLPHKLIYEICIKLSGKFINFGKKHFDLCCEFTKEFKDDEIYFEKVEPKNIIAFYLSYSGIKESNIYGSENSCVNLAENIAKLGYNVFIIDAISRKNININAGVTYIDIKKFNLLKNNYIIDVLILSRYINYFIEYDLNPKKIFLWIHDLHLCHYYKGEAFRNNGYSLLKNCLNKVNKIIVLTSWHFFKFLEKYDFIPETKVKIIGNGINLDLFLKSKIEKIPYRFIWTSNFSRNIILTINVFNLINNKIPEAELHIFRDYTNYENLVQESSVNPKIFFHGFVSPERIAEEFNKSCVWFYPTKFEETYCITALEAQVTKNLCIYNGCGSLNEVIGEKGIKIPQEIMDCEEKMANYIINSLSQNNEDIINKGYEFGCMQTWENKSKEWISIF